MPINYKWSPAPKLRGSEKEGKVYPRMVGNGTMTTANLIKELSTNSTYSPGEVAGLLTDMVRFCRIALSEGKSVSLDGLGDLTPVLTTSQPVFRDTRVKERYIEMKTVNFRPDEPLKEALMNLSFRKHKDAGDFEQLSEMEIDMRLWDYLGGERKFFSRRDFQQICRVNYNRSRAELKRLVEEGKLEQLGSRNAPLYVPMSGQLGVSREREEVSDEK